ncbi:CRISPR-associated helicase Cas3' [Dactylosporangium sp. NPDC000244]|uniref:CRISPR-associated helicase Cas3' n=1 Tax=Dactylosporangium sp. NPDC000244 TaxID=3154365 RepID=UPI0033231582
MDAELLRRLAPFWGKSNAGGRPNLLVQHLLDAAAVGELIWDRYLAPAARDRLDACCGGRGRQLFVVLCALHDVGKATPAFQDKVTALAAAVQAHGLRWRSLPKDAKQWHHTLAGGVIVRDALRAAGWSVDQVDWVVPMVTGHHGMVPKRGRYQTPVRHGHGQGPEWRRAQQELVNAVSCEVGVDLAGLEPTSTPSRAMQLALSGAVIMADWIASDSNRFPGIDRLDQVSMDVARARARDAWQRLELHGGWRDRSLLAPPGFFEKRFRRREVRPVQASAVELASTMPGPGLMFIEAPMGEGKTEAALAAAEVLASRFGADGVFVGMPTQATSDAMFSRVVDWAQSLDAAVPVGLLHGKRRFNQRWREMREARFSDVDDDEYGCEDVFGVVTGRSHAGQRTAVPAEWFLGPKRGLLMPITIGTIDQLLHAATRTRHVMLRHLGLAGRVVVLDEVHAYDVYMMQFLTEALRWLGDAGVPVVLLSATLPPAMRRQLAEAYLQGVVREPDVAVPVSVVGDGGYPAVRWVAAADGRVQSGGCSAEPWRDSVGVAVEVLDEGPREGPEKLVAMVAEALADGGCLLVVRNTVRRARQTFQALRQAFAGDGTTTVLLHARLMMGERVDRTERVLDLLGAPDRKQAPARPPQMIVVATQLAEQSFDVDADLLISDLAPIDLLLQRIGRLHRHVRPADARPCRVASPRVVVAGMSSVGGGVPVFPRGSEHVYGRYALLRAAHLVREASAGGGWSVPAQVPELVQRGYDAGESLPTDWQADVDAALAQWQCSDAIRRDNAKKFILAGAGELHCTDLAGLHDRATRDLDDDDAVSAVVRDGADSIEVVVLRRRGDLKYTLDGRCLGPADTMISDPDVAEAVARSTVRLPASLSEDARLELAPLSEAGGDPWLRRIRVLELDDGNSAIVGRHRLSYDLELGLVDEPAP